MPQTLLARGAASSPSPHLPRSPRSGRGHPGGALGGGWSRRRGVSGCARGAEGGWVDAIRRKRSPNAAGTPAPRGGDGDALYKASDPQPSRRRSGEPCAHHQARRSRSAQPPERRPRTGHALRGEPVRPGARPGAGGPLAGGRGATPVLGPGPPRALRLGRAGPPETPLHRRPPRPLQLLPADPQRGRRGLRAGPERAQ